jgi:S-adenosylmethionine synthetase
MSAAARQSASAEVAAPGHPDKIADQVADAVVDDVLAQDPRGRCGCEVLVNAHMVVVSGEFKTKAEINVPSIVKRTIRELGYTDPALGFSDDCAVLVSVREQSPEISAVIERKSGMAASDQGVMYGYASDETPEMLPLPLQLSRRLVMRIDELRRSGTLEYLRPDGKAQVSVVRDDVTGRPRAEVIVLAAQHDPGIGIDAISSDLRSHVIDAVVPEDLIDERTSIVINKLGRFVYGGPAIDTGVTGRKLVADTYGGLGQAGGGALCGKDPSKLDRTGAYYGRYVAKNLVAAGLVRRCQVQIAFAFGQVDPVATSIESFGTSAVPEDELRDIVATHFSFRPDDMIEQLDLLRPIYRQTARFGHFGYADFPWERTDVADALKGRSAA